MISRLQLIDQIKLKKSFLCVGLDPDLEKIPGFLLEYPDPVFEFNRRIIDATRDLCIAYKPNSAFYEAQGIKGLQSLAATWKYLPEDCLSIIDAKRGDIGNTSDRYAKAFFDENASGLNFDAITVAPYMGHDSVLSYLNYPGKWVILLALTSSGGSKDFQYLTTESGFLYEAVIKKAVTWAAPDRLMFVVGATKGSEFSGIRKYAPDNFLLVPGVGAQGGRRHDQRLRVNCKFFPFDHIRLKRRGLCRSRPRRSAENSVGDGKRVGKSGYNLTVTANSRRFSKLRKFSS